MTDQQRYDDFCARLAAPYAERIGEVSGLWPLFGMPPEPDAMRSEELWIQGGENGMRWPENIETAILYVEFYHVTEPIPCA